MTSWRSVPRASSGSLAKRLPDIESQNYLVVTVVLYRAVTNGSEFWRRPLFSEGRGHKFESCRARHFFNDLAKSSESAPRPNSPQTHQRNARTGVWSAAASLSLHRPYREGRGIHGEQARPFAADLEWPTARAQWTMKEIEDVERTWVAALLATGMSIREIAEETGLHRSKVHRLKQRIEAEAAEGAVTQAENPAASAAGANQAGAASLGRLPAPRKSYRFRPPIDLIGVEQIGLGWRARELR
jgi:hypothetical protein